MEHIATVQGKFFLPKEAKSFDAQVLLWQSGRLELKVAVMPENSRVCQRDEYQFGAAIPGLPVDLEFNDGALFTPNDSQFRWNEQRIRSQNVIASLEKNVFIVALATVLVPVVFAWIVMKGIPSTIDKAVVLLPNSVPQRMGKDTLALLDKIYLDESELSQAQQQRVAGLWQAVLEKLALPPEQYQLQFRASQHMGANAFALPNGTVVVTDDIVELLEEQPNAMMSVLLHEIGHVEHRHSLKLVGRSVSTSVFFAVFLGGVDGIGEVFLGASSSLLDSAFSRGMESEADNFAFDMLEQLKVSPGVFAEAMEALRESQWETEKAEQNELDGETASENEPESEQIAGGDERDASERRAAKFAEYFSSHPLTQDRIDAARQRGEAFERSKE